MEYISICGFKCHECAVYIATLNDDKGMKARLAEKYTSEKMGFTAEEIDCRGCHCENSPGHKFCGGCEIKACACVKKVANCGKCADYPCEILDKYVPQGSENRKILDEIKKGAETK